MATFNVDSLDFEDDEEARFGADADFATRFDSGNTRLELEDLTNATVGYVPQNVGTDLVGGKLAETVSEGKALADDGNVYDTIQEAENNASSWVKVGPGDFRESVTIDTAGLTLGGSGDRSKIIGQDVSTDVVEITANNVTIGNLSIGSDVSGSDNSAIKSSDSNGGQVINVTTFDKGNNRGIEVGSDTLVANCMVENISGIGIVVDGAGCIVTSCTVKNVSSDGITTNSNNTIITNNTIEDVGDDGIEQFSNASDCIFIGNRIIDSFSIGLQVIGNDNIVANNRISNSGDSNIDDSGTGTVLDANLTT